LVLGVTGSIRDYLETLRSIDRLIVSNGHSHAVAINHYLQEVGDDVATVAVSGAITSDSFTFDEKQAAIEAILAERGDIESLYTVRADGIAINDGDLEDIGENYSQEAFFINGMATQGIYVDVPSFDPWSQNVTMTISYRMDGRDGFSGLVCMDIRYDVILDLIKLESAGETGYNLIVDPEGAYLAHPDEQLVIDQVHIFIMAEGDAATEQWIREVLSGETGRILDSVYRGERIRAYASPLPMTGWTLITIAKPEEFMDAFHRQLATTGITVVVCLVLSILFSAVVSRRITSPLGAMAHRMEQFAAGILHAEMPEIHSRNEIGILYLSLRESVFALSAYLDDLSQKLNSMASGDLRAQGSVEYAGDFAPIRTDLERIRQSMHDVIRRVMDASKHVNQMARQMSASAQALSGNAVSQAGAIDQIDANFSNIKDDLRETADNATIMLDKISEAKGKLVEGNEDMSRVIDSMREIQSATSSIRNIIKVIDDIAFQTNILSLNAAIEAARAGVHGKGFGVVADEVRALANRSAASAQQTESLITNALAAVERSAGTVEHSGIHLAESETLMNEVTELVRRVETAAGRQARAADEIYEGVAHLNTIVQADTAMSEETAANSIELSTLAGELEEELSFFKLE
jgi:methyl-accepting chemotaxis protein